MRPGLVLVISALSLAPAVARLDKSICGSYPDRVKEERHLHARAVARRQTAARAAIPDAGDIAILEDSGGVVARRNPFDLDLKTIQFSLVNVSANQYRFQTSGSTYDGAAASAGAPIPLGDDDSALFTLPFPFPFFGNNYQKIFVNSDGNLTFQTGDSDVAERTLGRMAAGPPRLAPLFMDLDPSKKPTGVRVLSEAARFIVSWNGVPEYSGVGVGNLQTFQVRLYPDGRIEFAYNGVDTDGAVVGISPGGLRGSTTVVSFSANASGIYSSTVAETFGGTDELDIVTAAQKFYQTHDDAYDYLVFYNNEGIGACAGSVSCEVTVRNHRTGYGDVPVEVGAEYGSPGRLQSVLNMGPLGEYPIDPNGPVAGRGGTGDTPVTLLGHESGHLFLAYASIRDPNDLSARPMLGSQLAHWAFTFNSEASLLEGNLIQDNGPDVSPRFLTTGTVQQYAPLDQYLMGLRPPGEVSPTFLVTGPTRSFALQLPRIGVPFDGRRQDITVDEIIAAEGRRTPDDTMAQRRFHLAFVLVVPAGSPPSQAALNQIDTYRRQFEAFYSQATSARGIADTSLRLSLKLSTFPAAGVIAGSSFAASLSIQTPAAAPLEVALKTLTGAASVDPSVTIPAGATSAMFHVTGLQPGVDEIDAQPADSRYDAAVSRVQVLSAPDAAQLTLAGGDAQSATLRVTDINNLPYPGVAVRSDASTAATDSNGQITFAVTGGQTLSAQIAGASAPIYVAAGSAFSFAAPVNAASGAPGLAPGEIVTIFGSHLGAGAQVSLDGVPASILFAGDSQINFVVPPTQAIGSAKLSLLTAGVSADLPVPVPVTSVSPGIFFDSATGYGAILNAGTALTTRQQPVPAGGFIEIYATGLGDGSLPVQVTIGGAPANVVYSGPADHFNGLFQVNAQIPADTPSGPQPLSLTVNGIQSNIVRVEIR
jgi:uncharacterized protein (TIGR03437 family)